MSTVRFIGLDVHAETIAVAVAEPGGEVRSLGEIPNRGESIRRLVKKLGPLEQLQVCYEAGPTGYVVYWQLTALGVRCEVIAPTLVPVKAGDRVKTDRRDAEKLARSYRAGTRSRCQRGRRRARARRGASRARPVGGYGAKSGWLADEEFAKAGIQREDPDALDRNGVRVSGIELAAAPGVAEAEPVGGAVAGP